MTVVYTAGRAPPNLLRVAVIESNPRTLARHMSRLVGGEHQVDVLAIFGVDERDLPTIARRCVAVGYRVYSALAARNASAASSETALATTTTDVLVSRFALAAERKFSLYSNTSSGRGLTITRLVVGGGASVLVATSSLDADLSTAASQLKCIVRALPTLSVASDVASLLLLRDPSRLRPRQVQQSSTATSTPNSTSPPAQYWSSTIDAIDADRVVGGHNYATAGLDIWTRAGSGGGSVGVLGVDRVCVDDVDGQSVVTATTALLDRTAALVGIYTITRAPQAIVGR